MAEKKIKSVQSLESENIVKLPESTNEITQREAYQVEMSKSENWLSLCFDSPEKWKFNTNFNDMKTI